MSNKGQDRSGIVVSPLVETLEQRLLMTTLHGGEQFYYYNSSGQMVRIDLTRNPDDPTAIARPEDAVEMFGYDSSMGGLVNLVGLLIRADGSRVQVGWDDNMGLINYPPSGTPTWTERNANPGVGISPRGARNEVYSIYVANADEDTYLLFTRLSNSAPIAQNFSVAAGGQYSTTVPLVPIPGSEISTPGGGSVYIGGYASPTQANPNRYLIDEHTTGGSAADPDSLILPPWGVFPGGTIAPGIHISDSPWNHVSPGDGGGIGTDVRAVAVEGHISYIVDLATLRAVIRDNASPRGIMGRDVQSLSASNTPEQLYSVDNTLDTKIFFPASMGDEVASLASDGQGKFYFVDQDTNQLKMVQNGAAGITTVGTLVDGTTGQTYVNVQALEFGLPADASKPATMLYAVGQANNAAGVLTSYLITVSTTDGKATRLAPISGDGAQLDFTSLAMDSDGTLYGYAAGSLYRIDLAVGATLGVASYYYTMPAPVDSMDFIFDPRVTGQGTHGTLYAVLADPGGSLLRQFDFVNLSTPDLFEVLLPPVGPIVGMTFDASLPGCLYGVNILADGSSELVRISLSGQLERVNSSTGTVTRINSVVNSSDNTIAYRNVSAMELINGEFYAVAEQVDLNPAQDPPADFGRYLITISANGRATPVGRIVGDTLDLSSLAWDSDGNVLYGVDSAGDELYSVDINSGLTASLGSLPASGFVGLEAIDLAQAGDPAHVVIYGVTASDLYVINPADPAGSLLISYAQTDSMTSLAYDPATPGMLWTTVLDDLGDYRLASISIASMVNTIDATGRLQQITRLTDITGVFTYLDVNALCVDAMGVLWGVGTPMSMDPLTSPNPGTGQFLIQIDPATGVAIDVAPLTGVSDLSSIAFDLDGNLYGVDPDTGNLVEIDPATGQVISSVALSMQITGLDFTITGELWGIGPDPDADPLFPTDALFIIDPATGDCLLYGDVGLSGVTGFSRIPLDPLDFKAVAPVVDADGNVRYQLIDLDNNQLGHDVGRIIIPGVVGGTIYSPGGSIETLEMGFFFGKIDVGQNLGLVISRYAGGAVPDGNGWRVPMDADGAFDSSINAGGNIGAVDVNGNGAPTAFVMYSEIHANNLDGTNLPGDIYVERELHPGSAYSSSLLAGKMADYFNDSFIDAEFLSHPTGNFYVYGQLNPTVGDSQDWYGLPLMAGQTVTIDCGSGAWNTDLSKLFEFGKGIFLFDSQAHLMDTLGYESVEDRGLLSGSYFDPSLDPDTLLTQKSLTFTAPYADIYYLRVIGSGQYTIEIQGGTDAALGAVIASDLNNRFMLPDLPSVFVGNAANLGAVRVTGNLFIDPDVYLPGYIKVQGSRYGAGHIAAIEAANIHGTIESDGHIGSIRALGNFTARLTAGAEDGLYNHNAHIQNVDIVGTIGGGGTLIASGSIGTVRAGNILYSILSVNYDGNRPGGHSDPYGTIDLIDDLGTWGNLSGGGVPVLRHGYRGNIGTVRVAGQIYFTDSMFVAPLQTMVFSDGISRTLYDDGGGSIKINAPRVPVIDPTTNLPIYGQYITPTYSYDVIGVDDDQYPTGGGGVIANLRIGGDATLTVTGLVEVGELEINGQGASPAGVNFEITGSGQAQLYYVESDRDFLSFDIKTRGQIISGRFGGNIEKFHTAGGVGGVIGKTGAWILGHDLAPIVGDPTGQPQYGYYGGYINGLDVGGDITQMEVDGSLQDLRVMGTIQKLVVDADHISQAWDGVRGIVWSDTRIGLIDVGDGLADDGGSSTARAGIFSTHSIGTVRIDGPKYLRDGVIYGELNGIIAAGSNDLIAPVDPETGQPLIDITTRLPMPPVPVDAIDQVIGTNGATLTAIVVAGDLDTFSVLKGFFGASGGVNKVSMSGPGAAIDGAYIGGLYVRDIYASAESDGISWSYFYGSMPPPLELPTDSPAPSIGKVTAGGPGMRNTIINATGGDIGIIKGLGSLADMIYNDFVTNSNLRSLSARIIDSNAFHLAGIVKSLQSTDVMRNNLAFVSGFGTVDCGGDFSFNSFNVSAVIKSMVIGGKFEDSFLSLTGPSTADLKSLVVNGDITANSVIESAGHIGSIIVKNGAIAGSIETTRGGWNNDVDYIETAKGFTGLNARLEVGGTLKSLVSRASLGDNPIASASNFPQRFEVWGDLNSLKVIASKTAPSDLYVDINVGGNIGTIDIGGTLYGIINTNGNMASLTTKGSLGGLLDSNDDGVGDTPRGRVAIQGNLGKLSIPSDKDIWADLTIGGSLAGITLRGGDIHGNIESLYGSIQNVSVTDGDINGKLTARSIGKVSVTNGSINGDITANDGSVASVSIKAGNLNANITAEDTIDLLSLTAGGAAAGKTVRASDGIKSIKVSGGDLAANIVSGRDLGSLSVSGGNLTGSVTAQRAVGSMKVGGWILASNIRAGSINSISADGLDSSIIASARDIVKVSLKGEMALSSVLAGLDIGQDGLLGTADDVVHAATIGSLSVGGSMSNSKAMAGVGTGADGNFQGVNQIAGGISTISKMSVKGGYVGTNMVMADTLVDARYASTVPAGMVTIYAPTWTILDPTAADVFGPASDSMSLTTADGLVLTLTGSGIATYDGAGNIYFEGTDSRSKLSITHPGGAFATEITITGNDDASLGSLVTDGNVKIGNVVVDGGIGKLTIAAAADNANWVISGGVNTAVVGNGSSLSVTTDDVGTWKMLNSFSAGLFEADNVGTFSVAGSMDGDLNVVSITNIAIAGDVNGGSDITSWNGITSLTVGGKLAGNVDVYCGDLWTVKAGNGFEGTVDLYPRTINNVECSGGTTNSFILTSGDFGFTGVWTDITTSYRSAGNIANFTVSKGGFYGLLASQGDIKNLSVFGEMTGKAWSGGNIAAVKVGSMNYAVLASTGDILSLKVGEDMQDSYVLAGFNPGDGECDLLAGETEDANLQIDAIVIYVDPALQTAEVDDSMASGTINLVTVGGDFIRSSITASQGPGVDGYCGNTDDRVGGTGYVKTVQVRGNIIGSGIWGESYGVFAANNTPVVTFMRGQPFAQVGNVHVGNLYTMAGAPYIEKIEKDRNSIKFYFSHALDTSTFDDTNIRLIVSQDSDIESLDDNMDMAGLFYGVYDPDQFTLIITLNYGSFVDYGAFMQLTLDDAVKDNRGNALDGEVRIVDGTMLLPSGDRNPGGDFIWGFSLIPIELSDVPAYDWQHGCAPTAAGMLVGYYDTVDPDYANLITIGDGTADPVANPAVYQIIASDGNRDDYALYLGIDDSAPGSTIVPDMSSINPAGAHPDDCLADYMKTSRSSEGLTYGGTWSSDIGPGIEAFFVAQGYEAPTIQNMVWGVLTWENYKNEIDNGRPVLLGVDADGDGITDHRIIGIGYDDTGLTPMYGCYDTWSQSNVTRWEEWAPAAPGEIFGVSSGLFVEVA